jgi:RNA polymerase sigma factor (sigma-70 family)
MDKDAFFSENYEQFCIWVERRRSKWRATSVLEFDDVKNILLARIYQQLHRYDEKRPLDRWTNTVISNGVRNLLRDNVYRDARPCISGKAPGFGGGSSYGQNCAYNLGDGQCGLTKSGLQDCSCKFFAEWHRKKQIKFAITAPLSIENHIDESHSHHLDFMDIDAKKKLIDVKIIPRLSKEEAKIYTLLFIQNMEEKEVGEKMGYIKHSNNPIPGYLQIRAAKIKIKQVARQILSEDGIE